MSIINVMKIALVQLNPLIGDLEGNTNKIIEYINKASKEGAELVIFPELSISGYPPRDLLEKQHFVERNIVCLDKIKDNACIPTVLGYVRFNQEEEGKFLYNCAAYINNNQIEAIHNKCLLPTYDVFDEHRYFSRDEKIGTFKLNGKLFAMTICEDLWNETMPMNRKLYRYNPVDDLVKINPDYIINIAASPFGVKKKKLRENMMQAISKRVDAPLIYVNQIGGQDELIFDGHSFVATKDGVIYSLNGFKEELGVCDIKDCTNIVKYNVKEEEEVLNALVLGLKDYINKCGFKKVVLGLSGGIDSALTAVIASYALGPENVLCLLMPSEFSSDHSIDDSIELSNNLGLNHKIIPIKDIFNIYLGELKEHFEDLPFNIAEENIQARIRGNLVMAFSNKFGCLPLSTGNKSELACGYCTLYGDMCGGLGVIADVYKTYVYRLCKFINRDKEIIPTNIITKPPSAELKPDQKDSDFLPEYDILDEILKMYIEEWASADDIIASGFDEEVVRKVVRLVDFNEYKRRQAAPALKISLKSFGQGRRVPIAQGWKEK